MKREKILGGNKDARNAQCRLNDKVTKWEERG